MNPPVLKHVFAATFTVPNLHQRLSGIRLPRVYTYQFNAHQAPSVRDGVAMACAGTDVALETTDVALMHHQIAKLPFLIALSRRTLTISKWNIAFGLAFNAFAVLAGGSGYLTPIMGAVVHNIGSVFVAVFVVPVRHYGLGRNPGANSSLDAGVWDRMASSDEDEEGAGSCQMSRARPTVSRTADRALASSIPAERRKNAFPLRSRYDLDARA